MKQLPKQQIESGMREVGQLGCVIIPSSVNFPGLLCRASPPYLFNSNLLSTFAQTKQDRDMRLNEHYRQTIVRVAQEVYGKTVQVYLFGSRTDDQKRGGDIDLLVRTEGTKKGFMGRIQMASKLKWLLGDQKIDIIGDHEESLVVEEALRTGIRLT